MNSIMDLLVTETGTLGVRVRTSERYIVPRAVKTISVDIQGQSFDVRYKISSTSTKIESDDIKKISNSLNISFNEAEGLLAKHVSFDIGYSQKKLSAEEAEKWEKRLNQL